MKCLYSNSFIRLDSFYDYCIAVGMSSLFINLILKTSNYLHMKVLNERFQNGLIYFFIKSGSEDICI